MWDVTANKKVNTLEGHSARVGALAWNGDLLSSGSRDRLILQVGGNLNISEYNPPLSCGIITFIDIPVLERCQNP